MKLQTASAAISSAKRLEEQSTKFYEGLSKRHAEGEDREILRGCRRTIEGSYGRCPQSL